MSTCAQPADIKIHEDVQEDGVPGFIMKVYQILEVVLSLPRNQKIEISSAGIRRMTGSL